VSPTTVMESPGVSPTAVSTPPTTMTASPTGVSPTVVMDWDVTHPPPRPTLASSASSPHIIHMTKNSGLPVSQSVPATTIRLSNLTPGTSANDVFVVLQTQLPGVSHAVIGWSPDPESHTGATTSGESYLYKFSSHNDAQSARIFFDQAVADGRTLTCKFIDNFKPVHMLVPEVEDGEVISGQCSGISWQGPTPGPPSTPERSQLRAPRQRHRRPPMQPPLAPDVRNRNACARIERRQRERGQAVIGAVRILALEDVLLSEPTGRRRTSHGSGRRSDSEASTFQTRSLRTRRY
jgi:hypothetical protein